jgi:DNA ligase-1
MLDLTGIITNVTNASGSIDKTNILLHQVNNKALKAVLKFIYDPYNKCCIGNNKLVKALNRVQAGNGVTDPLQVIKYLTQNNTGSDFATNYAAGFIRSIDELYNDEAATKLAISIVTQDLKMGIATKSLNNIFGDDFIPTVGCMLGTLYADVSRPNWPCIITEKLDGIRRILIKKNGVAKMFSRSGHEDIGCVDILAEAKHLPDNYVYDGELLAIGTFKDNIEWRQATSSIANSKGIKHELTFNIFDMIPVDEFYAGRSKQTALSRKILLGINLGDESTRLLTPDYATLLIAYDLEYKFEFIKPVPILGVANNMDEVTPIVDAIWKVHGEGVMLNYVHGFYEIKRSKDLMKVKFSKEVVLHIVGFSEGNNSLEDSLGSFFVEYKGATVKVSGQLTRERRQEIWNNQNAYLGKKIEIETFGESKNQAGGISLNCPIFKRFVGEDD